MKAQQAGDVSLTLHSRRRFLSFAVIGSMGSLLAACSQTTSTPPSAASAPTPTTPPAPPIAAPPLVPTATTKPVPPTAPPKPSAVPATWQVDWDRILAAARQEGTVVLAGPPGETYRSALTAFSNAYPEIHVDYQGVGGRDIGPKLIAERQGSRYLSDLYVGGPGTPLFVLKPAGVLDPIKPQIIRPDVLDDQRWHSGFNAGYLDNAEQYTYAFQGALLTIAWVNRDVIPESELSNFQQLLDPKWKGKISWNEPRAAGQGAGHAGHLLLLHGPDFLRRLYQQDVVITADLRRQAEWLVRGTHPIAIGVDLPALAPFRQEGLGQNVKGLDVTGESGSRLGPSFGCVGLINRAPHPNATTVYVNWLLSKDGQEAWVKYTELNSRRLDVIGPAETAPDPNKTYKLLNHESLNHFQDEASELAKQVFGAQG